MQITQNSMLTFRGGEEGALREMVLLSLSSIFSNLSHPSQRKQKATGCTHIKVLTELKEGVAQPIG